MDEPFDPISAGAVAVDEPPFDPTAHGAVPVQTEKPSIPALAGRTAWDVIKQVTGLHQPTSLSEVAQEIFPTHFENTLVGGMLGGAKRTFEQGIEAAKTPDFSPEKFAFAGNVVGQAGGQLLGLLGLKAEPAIAKTAPTLAETAGIAKPDIAQPVEPVATTEAKVATEAVPVAPEVAQPVPAATEATAPVLGKQEPVAPTTAAGTGERPLEQMSPEQAHQTRVSEIDAIKKQFGTTPREGALSEQRSSEDHAVEVAKAIMRDKPVNASAIEKYGLELPEGYVKQGDLYVKPSPVSEAPVSTAGSGIQETGGAAPLSTETTGGTNAIQEQSAGSILQHPQESVGETGSLGQRVEPSVQGETPAGTRSEGVTGAASQEVTPEIPEGAKVTLNVRTPSGKTVPQEFGAKEAEGIFTKEKSSYQALLNCLGA